jgi:hypothetical protein
MTSVCTGHVSTMWFVYLKSDSRRWCRRTFSYSFRITVIVISCISTVHFKWLKLYIILYQVFMHFSGLDAVCICKNGSRFSTLFLVTNINGYFFFCAAYFLFPLAESQDEIKTTPYIFTYFPLSILLLISAGVRTYADSLNRLCCNSLFCFILDLSFINLQAVIERILSC